ncbi:MAG: tRNA (adenosine(37)-N6)-threonylcarbamoyltransferase complex ATPase subunit type 1 TsaE [Pseudomonadota bacterium]
MELRIKSDSSKITKKLGFLFGKILNSATIIGLTGDLGTGKTVFVSGLAEGMQIPKNNYVHSPTFSILNVYKGIKNLYHLDLYRIKESYDLEFTGFYDFAGKDGVTAIEWYDNLLDIEIEIDIKVEIKYLGENKREIIVTFKSTREDFNNIALQARME